MNYLLTIEYEGTRYEGWQETEENHPDDSGKAGTGIIQN